MDIEYLHKVLSYLSFKNGAVLSDEILAEENLKKGDLIGALRYLESLGYSHLHTYNPFPQKPPYWEVQITIAGKLFFSQGGFQEGERLRLSPIRSERLSRWALYVAIISTVIALIALMAVFEVF